MTTPELTTQEKLSLNRRAKAHGLPCLWPEAELSTAMLREAIQVQRERWAKRGKGEREEAFLPQHRAKLSPLDSPLEELEALPEGSVPLGYFEAPWGRSLRFLEPAVATPCMAVDPIHQPPPSPSLWARVKGWAMGLFAR